MNLYMFPDVSHHKGDLNMQPFADAGCRMVISKASDGYNLPDKDNKYYWNPQRHYDSRFVDNFVNTRATGLVAGAYAFLRFDRPQNVGLSGIVSANLQYFMDAMAMLPIEHQKTNTVILDIEQSGSQLASAGLSKSTISAMAKDYVKAFQEHYKNLILYSGSWWTNQYLTTETTQWMAERMSVWEPEYISISGNMPVNLNYQPSLPKGFKNEYATTADDIIGKMFAWQFSDKGRFPGIASNIDINVTALPKGELYKLFNDGAVDPPTPPPPPTDGNNCIVLDAIKKLLVSGVNLIDGVCK